MVVPALTLPTTTGATEPSVAGAVFQVTVDSLQRLPAARWKLPPELELSTTLSRNLAPTIVWPPSDDRSNLRRMCLTGLLSTCSEPALPKLVAGEAAAT